MDNQEPSEHEDVLNSQAKQRVDERLKQLQEKAGDLCQTLDQIEKRLLEAAGESGDARPE